MPPKQKTTFDKKGKGTTTYKDYNPSQEKANAQLQSYISNNQDKKNEAPGISSILQDMPEKRADFVRRNTRKDGSLNSAALAMLNPYLDERPEYSRELNRLRTSSPEMKQAYARRFPVANFMMETAPKFLPMGVGALFAADQGMKANAEKQRIMNTPVNRPDGGFKNFVDFFKPKMNAEQTANTEIIEGETKPLVSPTDMNLQKAKSFVSPQDMGFLDDENIFDSEKAAIDEALPTGDIVYNPADDDFRSKVNFINQALDGANYPYESPNDPAYRPMIEQLFEKVKRNIGTKEIRPTVDAGNAQEGDGEDPIPGGQFDLTNPAFSDQTNLILSGDPDYDYSDFMVNDELGGLSADPNSFPEGGVSETPVTQAGQELVFSDGTPVTQPVDTGLTMVGDKIFPSSSGSQEAMDILNSNATDGVDFSGYPTMGFGFANGGSTNKYENMSTHEKLMRMAAEMYG